MNKILVLTKCSPLCPHQQVSPLEKQRYNFDSLSTPSTNIKCTITHLYLCNDFWINKSFEKCSVLN
jgi:hypothetical protein